MSEEIETSDRRKDGWTWAKEIIGTIVGVVLAMALPLGYLSSWMRDIEHTQAETRQAVAVHAVELAHLKEQRLELNLQLNDITKKLDILVQKSIR